MGTHLRRKALVGSGGCWLANWLDFDNSTGIMTPTDLHIYRNIYIYASYELHRPLITQLGIKTYQIDPVAQGEHLPGQLVFAVGHPMAYT